MYTYKRANLPKSTIELSIQVPIKELEEEYKKSFEELRKDLAVGGFRKGKVPKDVAAKHLAKEDVYQHVIRNYIPRVYTEIVQKEGLRPILQPRVELVKAKEGEDWEFKLKTAESPKIELGAYKEKVKAAKKAAEKSDIWVPGKDKERSPQDQEKLRQAQFQAALEALLNEVKIEIPDLLLEEEVEKRLAKLVDDVQKVGLTMDSYLKSKNATREMLNAQMKKEAEDSYKIEFILQEIADKEDIKVEQAELEKVFETIKNEKEKQQAQANAYYYAAFLRKQKTLDYVSSL